METLKGCGAGIQPAAARPQEALGPQLSSSMCPLGQLLLLPGPSCTSQPLPLTVYLPTPRWGVFLPTSQIKTSPLCTSFQGPSKKERLRAQHLRILALFLIYRGSRGQITELLICFKKYRAIKPREGIEEHQMHLAERSQSEKVTHRVIPSP